MGNKEKKIFSMEDFKMTMKEISSRLKGLAFKTKNGKKFSMIFIVRLFKSELEFLQEL